MSGTDAIVTLGTLEARMQGLVGDMHTAIVDVQGQWARLGGIGAQRDDHAAELLKRLLPSLRAIERLAGACVTQVDRIQADPFGDKVAAA